MPNLAIACDILRWFMTCRPVGRVHSQWLPHPKVGWCSRRCFSSHCLWIIWIGFNPKSNPTGIYIYNMIYIWIQQWYKWIHIYIITWYIYIYTSFFERASNWGHLALIFLKVTYDMHMIPKEPKWPNFNFDIEGFRWSYYYRVNP